jgi:hypothetical protein
VQYYYTVFEVPGTVVWLYETRSKLIVFSVLKRNLGLNENLSCKAWKPYILFQKYALCICNDTASNVCKLYPSSTEPWQYISIKTTNSN